MIQIFLVAAGLVVQDPKPAAKTDTIRLSFVQAVERARTANPGFLSERLDYDNSVIDLAGARAERYLPRLSLDLTAPEYISRIERRVDEDGTRFDRTERRTAAAELELDQPLPTGGSLRVTASLEGVGQPTRDPAERFSGVSFLGFEIEQQIFGINESRREYRLEQESFARATASFRDEERELTSEVMEAYYGLVRALKQAQIDSVLYVRDSIRNAASPQRGQRAAANEVDSLKFEIEATRSALNITESDDELSEARVELNEVLALPPGTVIIPDTVIVVERFVPDVVVGLATARANRQDLRLAQLGVENRQAGLRDARRTSPITLFLNSTLGFDGASETNTPGRAIRGAIEAQDQSRTIDLGIRIPLFDRFEERHAVATAHNELRAAEIGLADRNRRLEGEVRDAARSVNNAARRLVLAERQAGLTARALALQTQRYAANQITLVEFLIDQANAREAEIDMLEAQVDMLEQTEAWRRAIGVRALAEVRP
jgi:outer membrane protein TolC